jgi:hypothetical protein
MVVKRSALALALLLVGASAAAAPGAQTVYVVHSFETRHGADSGLSIIGANNARQLAGWFDSDPPADPPVAIYVAEAPSSRESAAPLAEGLGIEAKRYDDRDVVSLAASVRQEKGPVLVVADRPNIAGLLQDLSGQSSAHAEKAGPGDIWIIKAEAVRRERVGQE